MEDAKIRSLSGGANQSGLRDYNERLLLTMLQRNGSIPGSDLARKAGLSPQTVSVILRKLEKDGLLKRGTPVRGKVGKPSVPMGLAPDGVFSLGVNIGRRGAKIVLMDFAGDIRAQTGTNYDYPMPDQVFQFLEQGHFELINQLTAKQRPRLCGIGIATPFELWNWHEMIGAPAQDSAKWKDISFADKIAEFTDLPVFVVNDATAACRAEHIYGRGKQFRDYAYFFLAAFVGGGIVLNHSVFEGHQGNAGALGSLRSVGRDGDTRQLIDVASINLLEISLREAGIEPTALYNLTDWSTYAKYVDPWISQTAKELAKASLSTCSVIDFEAVVIDGVLPRQVKTDLVDQTRAAVAKQDSRGLILPRVEAGSVGGSARERGAACSPILSQFLLDTNAGLSDRP